MDEQEKEYEEVWRKFLEWRRERKREREEREREREEKRKERKRKRKERERVNEKGLWNQFSFKHFLFVFSLKRVEREKNPEETKEELINILRSISTRKKSKKLNQKVQSLFNLEMIFSDSYFSRQLFPQGLAIGVDIHGHRAYKKCYQSNQILNYHRLREVCNLFSHFGEL